MKDNHYLKSCLKQAYDERDKTCAYTIVMNWVLKEALDVIEEQEKIIEYLREDFNNTLTRFGM